MKKRNKENGTKNDDWETPEYIYIAIEKIFGIKKEMLFDPCPIERRFNGLDINWKKYNYVNPPYNRKGKEDFIRKAFEESKRGKLSIMLIPANTETKIFHDIILPNAKVFLIKSRVKFKGYNSKGEYVTDKTGQTGSMFVLFGETSFLPTINCWVSALTIL